MAQPANRAAVTWSASERASAERALPRLYAERKKLGEDRDQMVDGFAEADRKSRIAHHSFAAAEAVVLLAAALSLIGVLAAAVVTILLAGGFVAARRSLSVATAKHQKNLAALDDALRDLDRRIERGERSIVESSHQPEPAPMPAAPAEAVAERRRAPRHPLNMTLTVRCNEDETFVVSATTVDASASGAAIVLDRFIRLRSVVELSAGAAPPRVRAVVRSNRSDQTTGAPVIGVEYLDVARDPFGGRAESA
jgi:hypothetical protein